MPTDVAAAIAKYRRKTLFVRLNRVLREVQTAHKGLVLDKTVTAQGEIALNQAKVRDILDASNLYADQRHQYCAYALALDKSQREMVWMVDLTREHQVLRDRFERRGLDPEVLDQIDRVMIRKKTL